MHPSGLATLSFTGGLTANQLRLHSRRVMIALSHAIEEQAAASGPETVLIATFQRLSLFRAEASRYARLAPRLAQTVALGVADETLEPIPGVLVLPLEPGWPLVQEWVVLASGPTCCAALLSRDVESFRPDRRSHQFMGRWTTEPAEVDLALRQLFAAIEQPLSSLQRDRRAGLQTANAIRAALALSRGGSHQ